MPLLLVVAAITAFAAVVPADVPQEDWEETLAALAAGGEAASAADLADLAGPAVVPRNTLRWARRRAVDGVISDLVGLDLSAGPVGARVRLRRGAGEAVATGAMRVRSRRFGGSPLAGGAGGPDSDSWPEPRADGRDSPRTVLSCRRAPDRGTGPVARRNGRAGVSPPPGMGARGDSAERGAPRPTGPTVRS